MTQDPIAIHSKGLRGELDADHADASARTCPARDFADYLWRMCRRDELALRKSLGQMIDDRPLPPWVKVELKLVDEHYSSGIRRRIG